MLPVGHSLSGRGVGSRWVGVLLSSGALAATLGGCGVSPATEEGLSGRTPAQIVAAARKAAIGAATVHVAGSILRSGTPISLNMELVSNKGGSGRVAVGALSMQLAERDGALYVRGNRVLYERFAAPAAARRLRGTWLKGTADGAAMRPLSRLMSLRTLLGSVLSAHSSALARVAGRTIDGRRTVGVSDRARGGTIYVAAAGTPYPLEIVWNGAARGKLVLEDWNQPSEPVVPSRAINVKQLQARR